MAAFLLALCAVTQALALCSIGAGLPGASVAAPGIGSVLAGLGIIGPARPADSALIDAAAGAAGPATRSCQRAPAASPQAEPATLAALAPDRATGNPFDPVSGTKHEHVIDVQWPAVDQLSAPDAQARPGLSLVSLLAGSGLALQFARFYNSAQDYALGLGPGWSHSFDTRLARRRLERAPGAGLPAAQLQILQADGRRIFMRPVERWSAQGQGERIRYHGTDVADGVIDEEQSAEGFVWTWRWPSGRSLRFDHAGRLAEVLAPDLDRLALSYDDEGRLARIDDRHGRSLRLRYAEHRLIEVVLPDAQVIQYTYDSSRRLAAVRYPDGRLLQYHYEDSRAVHWLTGTTRPEGGRSDHRYDAQGRVIATRAHDADLAATVRARYRVTGNEHETWLTYLGVSTRYRWRVDAPGSISLLAVEGPGCEVCPPVEPLVQYDSRGRVLAYGPWRISYDARDRLVGLVRSESAGAVGPAMSAAWRFHYDSPDRLAQPARVEAPSVVPGRTRTLAFGYNPRGQLTELIETGYAPYHDATRHIDRRVRLVYAQAGPHAGKLVAIERLAPVSDRTETASQELPARHAVASGSAAPSAPTHVLARTEFRYDSLRRLEAVLYPQGLIHSIRRDDLGRPTDEWFANGAHLERRFDKNWQLTQLRLGAATWRMARDSSGRVRELVWGAGMRLSVDTHARELTLAEHERVLLRTPWPQERVERALSSPLDKQTGQAAQFEASNETVEKRDASAARIVSALALPLGLILSGPALTHIDAQGRTTETRFDDLGRVIEERSDQLGLRQVFFDALDRPVRWVLPGGAAERRRYDSAGRLLERELTEADRTERSVFTWQGLFLTGIDHPDGATRMEWNAAGRVARLAQRLAQRWIVFDMTYDAAGRLSERSLGDGLALRYHYDERSRPIRLELLTSGRANPITLVENVTWSGALARLEKLGGGVELTRQFDGRGRLTGLVWQGTKYVAPLARFALARQANGLISAIEHHGGEDRFAYDPLGRLIVRERHRPDAPSLRAYQAYSPAGDLQWSRDESGLTRRWREAPADAQGRPLVHGPWQLGYGPSGRIERLLAHERDEPVAITYRYNALGERVAKVIERPGQAARTTRFLYHQQSLAAEADDSGRIRRHFIGWQGRVLAIVDVAHDAKGRPQPSVHWLISDHLGTPHAATDERGRVVWRGRYSVFGALLEESGRLDQPLRFPGQYHDRETGLHDNYRRTYDPQRGRYLEPDPLGLAGGWNLYAYAAGNPVQASDPLGLILFAFDGTGNSDPARAPDTPSNVAKFVSLYAGDDRHYMSGVGTPDTRSGIDGGLLDAVDAGSARRRVDHMLGLLDSALRTPETEAEMVEVNVIGFSRGAAMARDFANTVAGRIRSGHYLALRRCVSLNFIGLWDTVAQFGLNGNANTHWNLGIPPEARVVVHAVALNEARRFYPLESIGGPSQAGASGVRLERGFIGDHGDIGGSHAEGDLSDVALGWMVEQARSAGVRLNALKDEWRIVTDPLLHDLRSPWQPGPDRLWRVPGAASSADRAALAKGLGLERAQAEAMVRRYPYRLRGVDGVASHAGRVDMAAYSAWLAEHYGQAVLY